MWKSSSDSKTRVLPKSARAVGRRQQVTGRSTEQLLTEQGRGWGRGQPLQLKLSLRSLDGFQASEGFKEKLFKLHSHPNQPGSIPRNCFAPGQLSKKPRGIQTRPQPRHTEMLWGKQHTEDTSFSAASSLPARQVPQSSEW